MLVATDMPFSVGDRDFAKPKQIPLVDLLYNVPTSNKQQYFYSGSMYIIMMDAIFQPSSLVRHCSKLLQGLEVSHMHLDPSCVYIQTEGLITIAHTSLFRNVNSGCSIWTCC